jgi:hypothetical protein
MVSRTTEFELALLCCWWTTLLIKFNGAFGKIVHTCADRLYTGFHPTRSGVDTN